MNKVRWIGLTLVFLLAAAPVAFAQPQSSQEEAVLVGRISHVDGQLLRYVPDEKDWVATVKDAPFGLDDALYSDQSSKAEFIMPNNTWTRIGGDTQLQLITLKSDVTVIDVASGMTRFYDRSSDAVIQATTPFGYVMAEPGAVFDLYVGDQSAEVIAIKGRVDFVHEATGSKYEVIPGSSSIIADERQVASGEGNVDADWDDWNADRDALWSKRLAVKGDSVRYLPPAIQDDAYALDESGRWEEVEYEGRRQRLWRPVNVSADWAPFTAGRWTVWNEDNTWVPEESFGYVTHHYGNWVLVGNAWFWAPPVVGVRVAPGVGIGFGWYPGRVAWIGSGAQVGWIPLAPAEPYYCHRYWGPRAVVVTNIAAVNINIGSYRWYNRAVVVNQTNFYSVNNYSRVRVTNINHTTIINNYRGAPVVNNTVINNYNTNRQRYNFTNVNVVNKPHQTVVNRITRNEKIAKQEAPRMNAAVLKQNVAVTKTAAPAQKAAVERPKISNKIVPASEVNKPASQVQFKQTEMKKNVRPATQVKTQGLAGPKAGPGAVSGQQEPAGKPGMTKPGERVQPAKPGEQVSPGRPGKPGEQMGPGRPGKPGEQGPAGRQGATQPGERVQPAKPGEQVSPGRPGKPGEQMGPGRPGKPGEQGPAGRQGATQPGERVQPAKLGEQMGPGRPGKAGEQMGPGRPGKPGEQMGPGRPGMGRQGEPSQGVPGQRQQLQEQRRPPAQDQQRMMRPQEQPQQRRPQMQEQQQRQQQPRQQQPGPQQGMQQQRPMQTGPQPGMQQPKGQPGMQQPKHPAGQQQQQGPAGKKKADDKLQ